MGDSSLQDFLQKIKLDQWIEGFGTYWDPHDLTTRPFKLWPRQADAARIIGDSRFQLIPKGRQQGVSEIGAERIILSAMRYPKSEYVVLSKSADDAAYFLERRVINKLENLPTVPGLTWPTWEKINKTEIRIGESVIRSLPTTSNSGISRTTTGVMVDECGAIDEQNGVSLQKLITNLLPSMKWAGDKGWIMMIGASHPGSYWNEFVKLTMDGRVPGFDLLFLPVDINPAVTPETLARDRLTYPSEADFKSQNPMTIDDFFIVREGLVYPQFDQQPGGRHVLAIEPAPSWDLYYAYDHGFRHPAVFLEAWHDRKTDLLLIAREHYWRETGADVIAEYIKEILMSADRKPKKMIADSAIFSQTGTMGVAEVFRRAGLYFYRSNKYGGKAIMDGSGALLGQRLTEDKIVIHPRCGNLINELANWRWDVKRKGEHPVDEDDDGIDGTRYLCAELDSPLGPGRKPAPPTRGYKDRAVRIGGRIRSWMGG